jgi:hypothetical protein
LRKVPTSERTEQCRLARASRYWYVIPIKYIVIDRWDPKISVRITWIAITVGLGFDLRLGLKLLGDVP